MTRAKRIKIISIVSVVAVIMVAALTFFIVKHDRAKRSTTTIMTCSVNPSVQFVLNEYDKVIDVVALNGAGESITLYADFKGLSAEDAVVLFAETSSKAGYIIVSSDNGTKLELDFNGIREDYKELSDSVISKVNKFFDENGIIAGAVATFSDNLNTAILAINKNATILEDVTKKEIMKEYVRVKDEFSNVSTSIKENFYSRYDEIMSVYKSSKSLAETQISEAKAKIQEAETNLSTAPESLKENFRPALDAAKEALKTAEAKLIEANQKLEEDYAKILEEFKEKSRVKRSELTTKIQETINEKSANFERRKLYYQSNKEAVDIKIKNYRETLVEDENN